MLSTLLGTKTSKSDDPSNALLPIPVTPSGMFAVPKQELPDETILSITVKLPPPVQLTTTGSALAIEGKVNKTMIAPREIRVIFKIIPEGYFQSWTHQQDVTNGIENLKRLIFPS
jgi:hypothetical protein